MQGTPEFASPEVVNYEPISATTDMWSGAVIHLTCILKNLGAFGLREKTFVSYRPKGKPSFYGQPESEQNVDLIQ